MPDLKSRVQAVVKGWRDWSPRVALIVFGFGIILALFYAAMELWWAVQDANPSTLTAFLVLCAVWVPIVIFAWSYRMVVLVAVLGMVTGAVVGVVPYVVIAIIMILLEQSPDGQATSRELSQLFNSDVFSQLFFVAGAASGGPIAVYAYHERKRGDSEYDDGR